MIFYINLRGRIRVKGLSSYYNVYLVYSTLQIFITNSPPTERKREKETKRQRGIRLLFNLRNKRSRNSFSPFLFPLPSSSFPLPLTCLLAFPSFFPFSFQSLDV